MSEVLGALFAVMVGLMYFPQIQNGIAAQRHTMADVTTAQQQQQWVQAVTNYVNQNMVSLQASATTTPTPLTVATVKAANVGLPTGFSGTNPFNQTWTAAVTQPTAGNLQVLIYTTGGTLIKDQELGAIARAAGGVGGMIPTNNSGVYAGGAANAYGAFGAWQMSTAGYGVTGGSPASLLTFSNGTLTSNFLYRNAVPGQPQLNTMSTNLNMGTNNISNANQISSQSLQVLSDGGYGAPSVTLANGKVISYHQVTEGGVLGLVGDNGQAVYLESVNGKFRLVNSPWNLELFSVDQSGNVVSNGNVSANGNVNANGQLWSNGGVTTNGNVTLATSGAQITNPGRMHINVGENLYLQPWSGGRTIVGGGGGSGQLEVTGALYSDGDNYIYASAWPGSGCSQDASVRRDAATWKDLVVCAGGVWQKAGGGISSVVQVDSGGWQSSAVASCPGGYTLTGGSCDMNRGGDGREIAPRQCQPSGNGFFCSENNGGSCITHAICAQ